MNNKRIIIVTPPYYFDNDVLERIKELFDLHRIGNTWKEGHANTHLIAVDNLHLIPRISSEKLNRHNYFIFAGFSPSRLSFL